MLGWGVTLLQSDPAANFLLCGPGQATWALSLSLLIHKVG